MENDGNRRRFAVKLQETFGEAYVMAGSRDLAAELQMPCIQDQRGLEHIGMGNFRNVEYTFNRIDHSSGCRFYRLIPRSN